MDNRFLDLLRNAPSLDLYELSLAISQMLADPRRILDVRRHLRLGAQVMYFDHRRRTLVPGRVLQLQSAQVIVEDEATRTRWTLPYAAVVVEPGTSTEQAPPAPPRHADIETFKLGDTVNFTDKHLGERFGTIIRMNAKTCSLLCDGEQWRVSPGLLRKVIDV